ncbi:hypothetical protein DERF_000365 [Dermatophagoides farinae]|uniref:Secreted protein n=1 Tax=Dermatophagoides farinae TaxID=6954 RepID=A0A922I773_DERFA|nr:hypothetical protein DERF_000365 [Dermatophagoides farinae]
MKRMGVFQLFIGPTLFLRIYTEHSCAQIEKSSSSSLFNEEKMRLVGRSVGRLVGRLVDWFSVVAS